MCFCDDTRPEFWSRKTRVARNGHKCDECEQPIPRGTKYEYYSGKTDGDFWRTRLCLQCDEDWREMDDLFYRNNDEPCHCIGNLAENVDTALENGWIEEDDPIAVRLCPQEQEQEEPYDDGQLELPL
jgi:hypothetical protein